MRANTWERAAIWVGIAFAIFGLISAANHAVSFLLADQPTPQEPVTEGIEVPSWETTQNPIERIEEMTETFDAQGNVVERTTRIVIYADKVEAEG